MHINIKLEKEDIETCSWGDGVAIFVQNNFWIAMSWDAAKELVADIKELEEQKKEDGL
jgi:hypothetical protein